MVSMVWRLQANYSEAASDDYGQKSSVSTRGQSRPSISHGNLRHRKRARVEFADRTGVYWGAVHGPHETDNSPNPTPKS